MTATPIEERAGSRTAPAATLPGPSKTITVEPVEVPEREPEPVELPRREPEKEPQKARA
jgi:hypothetical protein